MDHLEFRLLGSIDACVGGRRLEIGPRKRRYVLAALLLDLNRPVPVERLIDAVWEGDPPDSARMTVQGHVYRLRRSLHGVRLESDASGYALLADPEIVDAVRFRRLVAEAARRDDGPGADLLDEALALWRGPALGDSGGGKSLAVAAVELEEARLAAVEELARRRLRLGQPERVVGPLRAVVTAEPHQERLVSLLMTSFYRLGRQAEALELYERTRRELADQLGVDPGPELRATFESLLACQA
ncbi:AfsR/SARP family transcriptional regulator [Nonomuraea sp. K274]|uniref:AfsR/SARP family transcriptional regulator n=1 Tax=Nonomuraea cypriaca TaxID=1187855 RepID=A0A931A485_9ACTN|nr:AfsR/SARP family transcriptional regulator [Nonomuraea cypriaca]MBF8185967.1 AfsR/SARP family transcriptional regulator [Nonomuraea cypriaca]